MYFYITIQQEKNKAITAITAKVSNAENWFRFGWLMEINDTRARGGQRTEGEKLKHKTGETVRRSNQTDEVVRGSEQTGEAVHGSEQTGEVVCGSEQTGEVVRGCDETVCGSDGLALKGH